MHDQRGLTRRGMLAGAAGGLALTFGPRVGWTQAAKRIEQLDPALDKIVDKAEPIKELATGYGGDMGPAEGPLWWKEGGYLLFNDIHTSRRLKYTPGSGVTVDLQPTNRANGLTRDLQGRLISCEHDTRRVTRRELDGSLTVIANSFSGKRLNRPNDVVVKSDGAIYFTDPGAGLVPEQWDLQYSGVYRVTGDLGSLSLLTDTYIQPNGLAFSPDEKLFYVNDSRRRHIRMFEMLPNGMKVDTAGNVYCGGAGGLWILDPAGKKLGRIVHGQASTTNIAFGGDDWKTLYFTTRSTLFSVQLKVAGIPVPVAAKRA